MYSVQCAYVSVYRGGVWSVPRVVPSLLMIRVKNGRQPPGDDCLSVRGEMKTFNETTVR